MLLRTYSSFERNDGVRGQEPREKSYRLQPIREKSEGLWMSLEWDAKITECKR